MCIEDKFDSRPLGLAIKEARERRSLTQEVVAGILGVEARHVSHIESGSRQPSVQVLYKLVRYFDIPINDYFHPEIAPEKSARRVQFDASIDKLTGGEFVVVDNAVQGIIRGFQEVRETEKS